MRTRFLTGVVAWLALSFAATGCSDDNNTPAPDATVDTGPDVAPDTADDSTGDAPADTASDTAGDTSIDAPADAASDAQSDAASDAQSDAQSDAATDTATDTASDAPADAASDAIADVALVVEVDAGAAARCIASGGTVGTGLCCMATSDFPNTCAVGACGCSPTSSHTVMTCTCPTGRCFDGTACIAR